jgi:hypothetical protein
MRVGLEAGLIDRKLDPRLLWSRSSPKVQLKIHTQNLWQPCSYHLLKEACFPHPLRTLLAARPNDIWYVLAAEISTITPSGARSVLSAARSVYSSKPVRTRSPVHPLKPGNFLKRHRMLDHLHGGICVQ